MIFAVKYQAQYYKTNNIMLTMGSDFMYENADLDGLVLIEQHLDPFGHSSAQASLFAQMNFDAFYFGRIDYDGNLHACVEAYLWSYHSLASPHIITHFKPVPDKQHRLANKNMEIIWSGSPSLGSAVRYCYCVIMCCLILNLL